VAENSDALVLKIFAKKSECNS